MKKKTPQAVESDRLRQKKYSARKRAKGMSLTEIDKLIADNNYPREWFNDIIEALNPTERSLEPVTEAEEKPPETSEKPPEKPPVNFAQRYLQRMPKVEEPKPEAVKEPVNPTERSLEGDVTVTPLPEPDKKTVTPHAPTEEEAKLAAKGVATITVGTFFTLAQQVMGEEWEPSNDEKEAILSATSAWFQEEGIGDMKPRTQVLCCVATYALVRLHKPQTQSKLKFLQTRVELWLAAIRAWIANKLPPKARKQGTAPGVGSHKGNEGQ